MREFLTGAVGVLLQLSVSRRGARRGLWGGATAPLRTVHSAVADPAHLLEDRADESNAPSGAAVHLEDRQNPMSATLSPSTAAQHHNKAALKTLFLFSPATFGSVMYKKHFDESRNCEILCFQSEKTYRM